MRRIASLAVVLTLFLSACSFEELLEFVDDSGGNSLADSPDAGARAAGVSVAADTSEKDADAEIDKALETKDVQHVDNAVKARPRDPTYLVYRAYFRWFSGDREGAMEDFGKAVGLIQESVEGEKEQSRRYMEISLDVAHDMLQMYGKGESPREQLRQLYCGGLESYKQRFGGSLTGAVYLDFFADKTLC